MTSPTISEHTRKLNDKMDDVFNMIVEDIKSQQELNAALLKMSHALSRVVKGSEERNKF